MTRLIDAEAFWASVVQSRKETIIDDDVKISMGEFVKLLDNAPTVEYNFEEAFQKTVCEQRLYCPERLKGDWKLVSDINNDIDVVCPFCNTYRIIGYAHGYSIEEVKLQLKEVNDLPNYCEHCGAKLGFGGEEE